MENDEMCGFWKLNYKILDKNLTIVLLYREVKCVENDEMCGFWSEISKYWIFTLLYYSDLIKGNKMCGKRWNVRILKLNFEILDIYFTIVIL